MLRRTAPPAAIACLMLLPVAGVSTPSHGGTVAALATVRVASGLNRPIFVTQAPGDFTRLFIVEQRGVIKILNIKRGIVQPTPFLDIDALVTNIGGNDERGLLGLAFHPDYQTNGFFYVYYTNNASDTRIVRYTRLTPDEADTGSSFTVMAISQPQANHNGGWIGFGPNDGYLYIATGDGGGSCDTFPGHTAGTGNAQDITNNLLGKMLRIDVDGNNAGNYGNPPDNPFVGVSGDDEIWAYGLRNPWRASFDRVTADLYIADVGQGQREELDFQHAASTGGENYGWRCMEGNDCSSISGCPTTGCTCQSAALTDPYQTYNHSCNNGGFSLTGGYVYRGCAIPDLDGTYFYADFICGASKWSLRYDGANVTEFQSRQAELSPSVDGFTVDQVAAFGEDAYGEMYIVDRGGTTTGQVFRIIPEGYEWPYADIDCDFEVGIVDFLAVLAAWGPCDGCPEDLDGDGEVGILDFLKLLAAWGPVG